MEYEEYRLDFIDGLEYENVMFRTNLSNMVDDELYNNKHIPGPLANMYRRRTVYYIDRVYSTTDGYRIDYKIKGQGAPSTIYVSPIPHNSKGFIWKFVDDFVKVNRRDDSLKKLGI